MNKRLYNDPSIGARCSQTITLRDGTKAQCGRRRMPFRDCCWQHNTPKQRRPIIAKAEANRMTDCEILVVSLVASADATKALAADLLRRFNCFDELLAACEGLVDADTDEQQAKAWDVMKAAIAKAKAT